MEPKRKKFVWKMFQDQGRQDEGRGQIAPGPQGPIAPGHHNTKFFKVWGPHKVNQQ